MDSTGAADSQSSPGQPGQQTSSLSDRIALLESRIDSIEVRRYRRVSEDLPDSWRV